jgi:S1-C subfamily serine protease
MSAGPPPVSSSGRTGKTGPPGDDAPAAGGQHRGMLTIPSRRCALAAVPMLLAVAAVAGCGTDSESTTSGIPQDLGAASLQRQFTDVVAKVSPQVVQIRTDQGLGSGIVYDKRGDIVTNAHVTGTAEQFRVALAGGDRRDATLVAADPGNDPAVIRMRGGAPRATA